MCDYSVFVLTIFVIVFRNFDNLSPSLDVIAIVFFLSGTFADVIEGDFSSYLFISLFTYLTSSIRFNALDIITISLFRSRCIIITELIKIHALKFELGRIFCVVKIILTQV